MMFVIVEHRRIKLLGSELALAPLARVRVGVIWMVAQIVAGLAHEG